MVEMDLAEATLHTEWITTRDSYRDIAERSEEFTVDEETKEIGKATLHTVKLTHNSGMMIGLEMKTINCRVHRLTKIDNKGGQDEK